jgi:hypothetical protein
MYSSLTKRKWYWFAAGFSFSLLLANEFRQGARTLDSVSEYSRKSVDSGSPVQGWQMPGNFVNYDVNNNANPVHSAFSSEDVTVQLPPPLFGNHHGNADAVFGFARGLPAKAVVRFVGTLIDSDYDGDIVLALGNNDLEDSTEDGYAFREYLSYCSKHHNLVVHIVHFECAPRSSKSSEELCQSCSMFFNQTSEQYVSDPRIPRHVTQMRFEYYWAWSNFYSPTSRILVSDVRDVYFQLDPFSVLPIGRRLDRSMQVFVEDPTMFTLKNQRANAGWILESRGESVLEEIGDNPIVCSGTTVGGQIAMVRKNWTESL